MLGYGLDYGQNLLKRGNLFIGYKYIGGVENGFHFIRICYHIGGSVTSVELHTFDGCEFGRHSFAFFDGDYAVFADYFHCVCDKLADFVVTCGNGSNLRNSEFVFNGFGYGLYFCYCRIYCGCNTFFENNGVCACGKVFETFFYDSLGKNDRGGGAVACNVVGFGGNFFNKLCAHIFERVFEFDFFCYCNAVVSNERCAEFFVEHNVSAFGSESDFNGIRNYVYARFKFFSCFVAVFYLFSHNSISP